MLLSLRVKEYGKEGRKEGMGRRKGEREKEEGEIQYVSSYILRDHFLTNISSRLAIGNFGSGGYFQCFSSFYPDHTYRYK